MDAELQIRDLALMIGVTEDTIINWELRGMMPLVTKHKERVNTFISGKDF